LATVADIFHAIQRAAKFITAISEDIDRDIIAHGLINNGHRREGQNIISEHVFLFISLFLLKAPLLKRMSTDILERFSPSQHAQMGPSSKLPGHMGMG